VEINQYNMHQSWNLNPKKRKKKKKSCIARNKGLLPEMAEFYKKLLLFFLLNPIIQ